MNNAIILVYHGIGTKDPFLEVPFQEFKKQIDYLTKKALIVDLKSIVLNRKNKRNVHIMFDDAFRSALPAMKYLDSRNLSYTVAIVEKNLGDRNYCCLKDLAELKNASYVYHTKNHKDLTTINRQELLHEITCQNNYLSKLISLNDVIVYPDGKYDSNVLQVVSDCGYKYGLTCLPFHLKRIKKPLEIPRININGHLTYRKFKLFISQTGNIYLHIAFFKRILLGQDYLSE